MKLVADSAKALTAKETAAQEAKIAELESALETERKGSADLLGKLASRTIRDEVMEAARAAFVRQEALADVVTMGTLQLKLGGETVQTVDGVGGLDRGCKINTAVLVAVEPWRGRSWSK